MSLRSCVILCALLSVVAVFATLEAWTDIFRIAIADEEQSHVLLVPIVSAWLFGVRAGRFRHYHPVGKLAGPAIVALGWAMSFVGYHYSVQSFWHAGAVVVLVGVAVSCLGINFLLRFFPAFAVLIFLVPVPGSIRMALAGPLQTATAATTQVLLETFGVPVERSMNLLTINGHDVAVAEACNGMRMVFALVLVSYTFAFNMPLRTGVRIIILLASPVAALVCNIIRLLPTVLLYGYGSTRVADLFHDVGGWIMLPIAFGMLMGIMKLFRWALLPVGRFNLAYQ